MKPLTVFSAFDGAGIGLLALKRAGVPIAAYYASEVDKYAIQVAKKNHPEIVHVGDVKQFRYLLDVYKCWGIKCFIKDQFYKPSYIAGFKFLKDILLNKRTVW